MTLNLFILLVLITGKAYSTSAFNLSINDGRPFQVVFDNEIYKGPMTEFNLEKISGGKHYLKVLSASGVITTGILFEDYIQIPDGYKIFAVIDDNFKMYIYKKINYNNFGWTNTICGYNCTCCQNCPICNPGNRNNENDPCLYGIMKDNDFDNLKSLVETKSFENTKIDFLKTAIDDNYFISLQVKEMMRLLSFEASKLEIAKYAYKKTCDKENYFKVYDAFTFESSITELREWIKKNK